MCLKPITIRNPTRAVYRHGGQQLLMQVPCGKCAECVKSKRIEWYFRSYEQINNTLKHGGYVLFDTLTYNNANLPKISKLIDCEKYEIKDFSCFSHADFKGFLKRLRRQLEYHCGNSSFKYFLTSEYGVNERFTHRPHYHIMFFIESGVHPYTFSKLISKCWQKGRTDGLPYQSRRYVAHHVYGYNLGYGMNTDFNVISSLCNYVAKYITKSSTFQKRIEKRIDVLRAKIDSDEELKKLIRQIDMFHRQSQGFGLSYCCNMTDRQLEQLYNGKVIMQDSKQVIKTYPIPTYYKRNLFYQLKKRDDKTYYWELTPYGAKFKQDIIIKSFDAVKVRYEDLLYNMPKEHVNHINKLLGNRTISDYVLYQLFYKGRSRAELNSQYCMTDEEYNLYDYLKLQRDSTRVNSIDKKDIYSVDLDTQQINTNEPVVGLFDTYQNYSKKGLYDTKQYYRMVTFNENSCPEFRHFDLIETIINKHLKTKNDNVQKTFEHIEQLKEKFKILKL